METPRSGLQRIEQSRWFQFTVMGMILLNTFLMAEEANIPEDKRDVGQLFLFQALNNVFLVFFLFEIAIRLSVYRCAFFMNKDWGWNWFDFTIVFFSALDQWVLRSLETSNRLSLFLRVLRMVRIVRAFRLFKHFRQLNILATGLIQSLQSVVWVGVLFLLVMFVYAILITRLVGKNAKEDFDDPEHQEMIVKKFGTIPSSMATLFIFLSCDDWSAPARLINKKYPWMQLVWMSYIIIGAFTLLSLLTGLMADKMNQVRTEEEESENKAKASKMVDFMKELKVAFDRADTSGDAMVDLDEFHQMLSDRSISEKLQEWGFPELRAGQARDVFNALDRDTDGHLSWNEFRDGILQLSRPSTSKDIMWLEARVFRIDRNFREYPNANPGLLWDHQVNRVHARAALISERLDLLQHELAAFFKSAGYDPSAD